MIKKIVLLSVILSYIFVGVFLKYKDVEENKTGINTEVQAIKEFINCIDNYKEYFDEYNYQVSNLQLDNKDVLCVVYKDIKYIFDIGLSEIFYDIDNDTYIHIKKASWSKDELINLETDRYTLEVTLYAPEYQKVEYGYNPFNYYNPDFERYRVRYDDEELNDIYIKKYISTKQLQYILKEGLQIQNKLVEIYENSINE